MNESPEYRSSACDHSVQCLIVKHEIPWIVKVLCETPFFVFHKCTFAITGVHPQGESVFLQRECILSIRVQAGEKIFCPVRSCMFDNTEKAGKSFTMNPSCFPETHSFLSIYGRVCRIIHRIHHPMRPPDDVSGALPNGRKVFCLSDAGLHA